MQSVKGYFRMLYTVYISILVFSCVFLFVALLYKTHNDFSPYDIPYIIAEGIVVILGFFLAYFYYQKNIKKAKRKRGIQEKLSKYKAALLMSWVILEVIVLFSIICYITTGELMFVCITIFLLVIILLNSPSVLNAINRLNLSEDEQRILENSKSAI